MEQQLVTIIFVCLWSGLLHIALGSSNVTSLVASTAVPTTASHISIYETSSKIVLTMTSHISVDETSSKVRSTINLINGSGLHSVSETISNHSVLKSTSVSNSYLVILSKNISTSSTYNMVPATSTVIYVIPTGPKPLIIAFSFLVNDEFSTNVNDQESLAYLMLESKVQKLINAAYKNNTEFLLLNIVGFESKIGQTVQCNGRLYFNSSDDNVSKLKQTLDKHLKSQNNGFGVMQFLKTKPKPQDKDGDDDDVVFGLDWWQIGVIIAGIVVLILLIAVISLCAKLRKIKKTNHTESLSYGNEIFGLDNNNELKALRASPPRSARDVEGQDVTGEVNTNKTGVSTFLNSSGTKDDGLVMQTEAKIGLENEKKDDEEIEYVTPLTSVTAPGDVIGL